MDFPEPVIELAIEPKSKADQEKLGQALAPSRRRKIRLSASRPIRRAGQTIIKGMGELHLEIKVDILRRTYKVDANVGAPQVAYRETLGRKSRDRLHPQEAVRRLGPVRPHQAGVRAHGSRARAYMLREQGRRRRGAEGVRPRRREGPRGFAQDTGVLAGFPVIDYKVTLIDGAYHDVDFSVLAFEIAARAAFREGLAKAQCKLLEPIMKVEVVTPRGLHGRLRSAT